PTIKSRQAANEGLAETLFEKVIIRNPQAAHMLEVQYRMPEAIMGFSNEWFYQGNLKAANNTLTHTFEGEAAIEWIDTAGSGYAEQVEEESLSTFNPEEARFACVYLTQLVERIGIAEFSPKGWTIGLIAPY